MDVSTYIAEQIPILQSLHAQLALPADALAEDTARIDAAVRLAIQSVVRSREDEVASWEEKINNGKRAIHSIARAVGDRGRSALAEERRETMVVSSLPAQYERLVCQTEELEKVYDERLAKVEEMMTTLNNLSLLLGPPFEPPAPLKTVPDSLAVPARAVSRRATIPPTITTAPLMTAPTTNVNKRHSARNTTPQPEAPPQPQIWLDVGEEVMESLEKTLSEALAERDTRTESLEITFGDLIWYASELDLPPLPKGPLDEFPERLLPPSAMEETPGAYERYTSLLASILDVNDAWQGEDDAEAPDIKGMEGVEPDIGLLNWAEQLLELWTNEKESRDARVQELYEEVEPLWQRLKIPQADIDDFIEKNRGSGESTIVAYEKERERVLEIRKNSLSSLVETVREEIAALQTKLFFSEDEKLEFGAYISNDFSEELLQEHEDEASRLRAEVNAKGGLLAKVNEWIQLENDETELEKLMAASDRFTRPKAMLEEERLRKRVERRKPALEEKLVATLSKWEEENGRPFLARGERVVDTIQNAKAAKETARADKKRDRMGLAQRHASDKATPAQPARRVPSSTMRSASNTTRKREAPTPCPPGGNGSTLKRSRIAQPSASRSTSSRARAGGIPRHAATPTPASGGGRGFGRPALGPLVNGSRPPVTQSSDPFKSRPISAKRRQSFKPRPSLAAGLLRGVVEDPPEADDEDLF